MATSTSETIIRLTDVGRAYRTEDVETHALSDVQLEIRRGEFLSISGPSGSGKSTLLGILGLLDSPTTGRYELGGQNVSTLTPAERTRLRGETIGFVFQSFNLLGELTVLENIELALSYRGVAWRDRREQAQDALQRVGMEHRGKHLPGQLSGGQQQRAAVARAIAGRPAVLLADEPTGNLDSANGQAVMALMLGLHEEGATICMVTHNPEFAAMADRDAHLFDGRVVEQVVAPKLEAAR